VSVLFVDARVVAAGTPAIGIAAQSVSGSLVDGLVLVLDARPAYARAVDARSEDSPSVRRQNTGWQGRLPVERPE